MNFAAFDVWIEKVLVPEMEPSATIMLDNLA